jgi:hypothetical protein
MKLTARMILCAGVIALVALSAIAQTPTSGAMLAINGTVGTTTVSRAIYDSQIHTANVVSVGSNCSTGDAAFKTDAYVLQGGSPTGCDPGDAFETSQGTGSATLSGTGYAFGITTQYTYGGCTSANVTPQVCANPDTGFLTVTNNSGASFNGTITLSGTAVNPSSTLYCPNGGVALSTFSGALVNGGTATFALSPDSSNCGGWNQDQTLTVTAGQTTTFPFGNDAYQITPYNSAAGDQLVVRPVAVPLGMFSLPPTSPYYGQNCIPYADTSAPAGATGGPYPVCMEMQVTCPYPGCSDSGSFLYTAQVNYTIDPVSLPNGIGGPAFLGIHGENCPPADPFNLNIFLSYTPDPTKGTGGGTGSCYVTTYSPTAPITTNATQQTFIGFTSPVVNGRLTTLKAGSTKPLSWQTLDSSSNPVTNLSLCGNTSGTGCTAPWVNIGTLAIDCTTLGGLSGAAVQGTTSAGGLGLQNLGNGNYQYNWQTVKGATGCVTPVLQFSSGFVSIGVADFQYK